MKSIDHIAIVVRDLDKALTLYRDGLGLEMKERGEVESEGVEIALLSLGRETIELVRPLSEESSVARFLEKRGEGLHHVCLSVSNVVTAMEELRNAGAELITDQPQVGEDGTRYVFVHPRSAHGVLLELYELPE